MGRLPVPRNASAYCVRRALSRSRLPRLHPIDTRPRCRRSQPRVHGSGRRSDGDRLSLKRVVFHWPLSRVPFATFGLANRAIAGAAIFAVRQ